MLSYLVYKKMQTMIWVLSGYLCLVQEKNINAIQLLSDGNIDKQITTGNMKFKI